MKIYQKLSELIGNTPLLKLNGYGAKYGLQAAILAKLEGFNPAGSVKDRVALAMIETAEADGLLKPGGTIIEPTSGNTGIGLACIAASKGYKVILTMPDTMSRERRDLLAAYGAQIVLTPGSSGMSGAIDEAKRLLEQIDGSFMPSQFTNPANPLAHKKTTGPEIWRDTDGLVDCFVAGVGTGGSLSGTGEYLKDKNPAIKVVAVEPADSPLLSKGQSGSHGLQGIGADFIPQTLDLNIIDEVVTITTEQAFCAARALCQTEGLLVGISSGAALAAATDLAKRPEYSGKNIVVLLPDTGEKYLSTGLFGRD